MAELFQKDVRTINEHLQNIYEEGSRQVNRNIDHYFLSRFLKFVIICVIFQITYGKENGKMLKNQYLFITDYNI